MAISRRPHVVASVVAAVVALAWLVLPWPGPVVGLFGAGPPG